MSQKTSMRKADIIALYGEDEWIRIKEMKNNYRRRHKEKVNKYEREYHKEHYNENKEKLSRRAVFFKRHRYVENGRIDLVKNYELAKNDDFKGWTLHHILGEKKTRIELLNEGLYYDRPPEEFIWMTDGEHKSLHNLLKLINNKIECNDRLKNVCAEIIKE